MHRGDTPNNNVVQLRTSTRCVQSQFKRGAWGVRVWRWPQKTGAWTCHRRTWKPLSLHQLGRPTSSLGISSEGLTKHKSNSNYTKPHKFCERLDMFLTLKRLYEQMGDASAEDKRWACIDAFKNSWISQLVPELWLFAFKGHENDDTKMMVLRAGPFSLLCIHLIKAAEDGSLVLAKGKKSKPFTVLVTQMDEVLLAKVEPCVGGSPVQLHWKATTPWMDIPHWIAEYGILTIANTLFSRVCSKMKLAGHTKLDHYYRVELFLKHLGTPQERIEEILALLPQSEKGRKRKNSRTWEYLKLKLKHMIISK